MVSQMRVHRLVDETGSDLLVCVSAKPISALQEPFILYARL